MTSSNETINRADSILPEKTPLYIGPGIVIKGDVTFMSDETDQRLVVLGEIQGNVYTNAVLQVADGGVVNAAKVIEASEVVVSGKICGEGVVIRAKMLVLNATGNIAVEMLCLPPGGLEQSRGGVLNARLNMSAEYAAEPAPVAAPAPAPVAVAVAPAAPIASPVRDLPNPSSRALAAVSSGAMGASFGSSVSSPARMAAMPGEREVDVPAAVNA